MAITRTLAQRKPAEIEILLTPRRFAPTNTIIWITFTYVNPRGPPRNDRRPRVNFFRIEGSNLKQPLHDEIRLHLLPIPTTLKLKFSSTRVLEIIKGWVETRDQLFSILFRKF